MDEFLGEADFRGDQQESCRVYITTSCFDPQRFHKLVGKAKALPFLYLMRIVDPIIDRRKETEYF